MFIKTSTFIIIEQPPKGVFLELLRIDSGMVQIILE